MKLKFPWVIDPNTKLPSVSLTNLFIATLFLIVAASLHLAGKVETTSIAIEYFGISSALYFGRRINIGKKEFSSSKKKESN